MLTKTIKSREIILSKPHLFTCEIKISHFPNFLKKAPCIRCQVVNSDKKIKELIFASRILEVDGTKRNRDFSYDCGPCALFVFREEKEVQILNPQEAEEIRRELKKYAN